MPSDVEPAGEVVQGDGTYSGDEDAVEHPFEFLEYLAVESAGMGQGMIHLFALFVEHHVGKVVVFIDDEVEWVVVQAVLFGQVVQFGSHVWLLLNIAGESWIEVGFIDGGKGIQFHGAIFVEQVLQLAEIASYAREVERED